MSGAIAKENVFLVFLPREKGQSDINMSVPYNCGSYLHMVACSVAQWCSTHCHPIDCSQSGSSVHGIFQARIGEWVVISSSKGSRGRRLPYH